MLSVSFDHRPAWLVMAGTYFPRVLYTPNAFYIPSPDNRSQLIKSLRSNTVLNRPSDRGSVADSKNT